MKNQSDGSSKGPERRNVRRRTIAQSMAIFVVIPKKGIHRLNVYDLSEDGIKFDLDIEGESMSEYSAQPGDLIKTRFYVNQSLYIPLAVKVIRVEAEAEGRRVGAVFPDRQSQSYKALLSFLQFMDNILDIVKAEPQPIS